MSRKGYLLILAMLLMLTACGGKSENSETQAPEQTEAASEQSGDQDEEGEFMEESPFEVVGEGCIDMSTINVSEYVTLGAYTDFDLEMIRGEVTEESVLEELDMLVNELSEKNDTGKPAEIEDYLDVSFRLFCDGEILDEDEEYQLYLGYNNLGEEADQALLGANVGDKIHIPVDVNELYGWDDVGEGTYEIEVKKIYQYKVPEVTDELIRANTEYATVDEYKAGVLAKLQKQSENENRYQAQESAVAEAVAAAEVNGCPQELYDYVYGEYESLYQFYADMYEVTLEELLGDMSLEDAAMEEAKSMMVVAAIAAKENLVLSDEAYEAYLEASLEDYGFEDIASMKAGVNENYMKNYAVRAMVGDFILEHSHVTELSEAEYYEKYYASEELDEELDEEFMGEDMDVEFDPEMDMDDPEMDIEE